MGVFGFDGVKKTEISQMLSTAISPDGNLLALGFFHFGVQLTYYASG